MSKSAAKPEAGPECSVPASGWPGMKWTPARDVRAPTAAITARLTEPTSLTVAPGFRPGAISAATAPMAPTGTQRMTRSAPCGGLGGGVEDLAEAEAGGLGAGLGGAGVAGDPDRRARRGGWRG